MTLRHWATALAICVALAGCGGGGGGGSSGGATLPTGSWDSMNWDQAAWG
jgi:hypothetical protein